MSFAGSNPLTSTSGFLGFAIPPLGLSGFFSVPLASNELQWQEGAEASSQFLITYAASGAQTDNCYMACRWDSNNYSGGTLYVGPAFGLDGTHFISMIPIFGGGGINAVQTFVNNGGSLVSSTVSIPLYPVAGAPFYLALGLVGTTATLYISGTGASGSWTALSAYDASGTVSSGDLLTWVAAQMGISADIASVFTSYFVWGPTSDLLSTTVPDVIGDTQATAATAITGAGLIVGTVTYAISGPIGEVFAQSPVGGTSVAGGSAVDISVSGIPVPNLFDVSLAVAEATLAGLGLTTGTISYQSDVLIIPGNIDGQSPAAGTLAGLGDPVNVTVSTGRAGLTVPLILFLTQAEAITALEAVGLVPGAISFAPSTQYAAGEVMAQNPKAGTPIGSGGLVSFVISTGSPVPSQVFDFEATVISQYANSPTLLQLVSNMNQYVDQSVNFANFYTFVWNVDSAQGFGLDIWGKIVGVSRLLHIPNATAYFGFEITGETQPDQDWTPFGSSIPVPTPGPPGGNGTFYTGYNATQTYLLDDDAYRQLILAKAFANICATTAPSINRLLQNLYGPGSAWVLNTGTMSISYNFNFTPSPIQLAILQQSGIIPTPPGVAFTIVTP